MLVSLNGDPNRIELPIATNYLSDVRTRSLNNSVVRSDGYLSLERVLRHRGSFIGSDYISRYTNFQTLLPGSFLTNLRQVRCVFGA